MIEVLLYFNDFSRDSDFLLKGNGRNNASRHIYCAGGNGATVEEWRGW